MNMLSHHSLTDCLVLTQPLDGTCPEGSQKGTVSTGAASPPPDKGFLNRGVYKGTKCRLYKENPKMGLWVLDTL